MGEILSHVMGRLCPSNFPRWTWDGDVRETQDRSISIIKRWGHFRPFVFLPSVYFLFGERRVTTGVARDNKYGNVASVNIILTHACGGRLPAKVGMCNTLSCTYEHKIFLLDQKKPFFYFLFFLNQLQEKKKCSLR